MDWTKVIKSLRKRAKEAGELAERKLYARDYHTAASAATTSAVLSGIAEALEGGIGERVEDWI